MKILEIAGSGTIGTDDMGPVSNDIYQLCKKFCAFNQEVTVADVITQKKRTKLNKNIKLIEIESVSRSRLNYQKKPNSNLVKNISYKYQLLWQMWQNEYFFIKEILSKFDVSKFDILHIHESLPAIILNKKFKYEYVYTSHTPTWHQIYLHKNYLNYIQKLKINLLTAIGIHEKNAIQNSLLTIGLGNYLKEHFNNKNIMIIQNGIDPIKWKPLDRMQARYQLGYNENDFILLFIGRVLPIKGVDILINAIRQLGPNYKDLYAIVIGSLGQSFENRNEINPYAKKMLQESKSLPIEFKGFISNQSNEFRNFIAAADFLVLPSVFEPQGNVILEAMSMEVPVLASATGGIKDIIHEKVGKLFKSGDFMQLASLLKYYYFNRDDIWDMKKNCRSYVEKNFTWDISAKKHIHAFKNLSKLNYSLRQNL